MQESVVEFGLGAPLLQAVSGKLERLPTTSVQFSDLCTVLSRSVQLNDLCTVLSRRRCVIRFVKTESNEKKLLAAARRASARENVENAVRVYVDA